MRGEKLPELMDIGKELSDMGKDKDKEELIAMREEYQELNIYPGVAPGSEDVSAQEEWFYERMPEGGMKQVVQNVTVPTIMPFLPEEEEKTKELRAAVLVIPGGAYRRLVINYEGVDVAKWLNSKGIAAFVLKCRLPVNEHENREDVALMDAQRAIRLIRSNGKQWGIDVNKIGVMGFSAGGSIASTLATCYDRQVYKPIDDVDNMSARPDFCVLGYPAVSAEVEKESRRRKAESADKAVAGVDKKGEVPKYLYDTLVKYSTDTLVTKNTPPAFIMETDEDITTLSEHSVKYYLACRKAGVPAELHIFQTGAHGFGLGREAENGERDQTGQWKELFLKWLSILW